MDLFEKTKGNLCSVDLREIPGHGGPYCMSFGFDLGPLIRSIQAFGLINPPLVARNRSGRLEVVVGFRRLLALKSLGWDKVPCRDISAAGLSSKELLLLNLHDNLATRGFNAVEKGMILNRLAAHMPREEIVRGFMPLLDLPSHEDTLDVFMKLEGLEEAIKGSLAQDRISFQALRDLLEADPHSRSTLFEWIRTLKLNKNHQRQFIEMAREIALREGMGVTALLGESGFQGILQDPQLNPPQKTKRLLALLHARRFPSLTSAKRRFREMVQGLGLPQGVKVHAPPFFEGAEYRLEIGFRNGRQLKEKIEALQGLESLKSLDDPWKGGEG